MKIIISLFLISFTQFSLAKELVITATGDLGFTQNMHSANGRFLPDRACKHGNCISYQATSQYVAPAFYDSDINFTNVETVVADSLSGIGPRPGGFRFVSHINSMRAMIDDLGMNLFSLSNNHAYDYGVAGMQETLQSFETLSSESNIEYAGVGTPSDLYAPVVFRKKGLKIAFAAINGAAASTMRPGNDSPVTQLNYLSDTEYETLLERMAATDADFKILSIHYGTEKQIELNSGQKSRFRKAVDLGDVDLVIGHHPHRVRAVEKYNGAVIFYSLGNFLFVGGANIDNLTAPYDYGAIGKVYYDVQGKNVSVSAVEMIPIQRMHIQPFMLSGQAAATRVSVLNRLARSGFSGTGLEFDLSTANSGIFCIDPKPGTQAAEACASTAPLR